MKKLAKFNEPIQITFIDTNRKVLILINFDQGIKINTRGNAGNHTARRERRPGRHARAAPHARSRPRDSKIHGGRP